KGNPVPHIDPMPKIPRPEFLPTVADIRAAAERISSAARRTRMLKSNALSERVGSDVFLKCELEQQTGSFKVRGAFNVLASLTPEQRARGVVASSAGNHGLGVAFASHAFGAPAMLYVPSTAPQVKKAGIAKLGATVNDEEPDYDAAMVRAKAHAAEHNIPFINPCLGYELLAGQGTVALEVLEQCPDVRTIVICTGGGGLLGGMGAALRELAPSVRIIGAQSEHTAALSRSVAAGHVVPIDNEPTLADGLAGQIDDEALAIGLYCADQIVTVTEAELGETIAWLWQTERLKSEGAGAVAVAALRHGKIKGLEAPVVALVSGGNIDDAKHAALLATYPSDAN
ncbi:MAG: threonine/serine dehydratase, partial [Gemmatimonadaceae bacterium]